MTEDDEIFTLHARICKRCGRILTKAESVEHGYGCRCAKMENQRQRDMAPIPGQIDIYDWMKEWK